MQAPIETSNGATQARARHQRKRHTTGFSERRRSSIVRPQGRRRSSSERKEGKGNLLKAHFSPAEPATATTWRSINSSRSAGSVARQDSAKTEVSSLEETRNRLPSRNYSPAKHCHRLSLPLFCRLSLSPHLVAVSSASLLISCRLLLLCIPSVSHIKFPSKQLVSMHVLSSVPCGPPLVR